MLLWVEVPASEPLPGVLAKARRFIASEAELRAVDTLHFSGSIHADSGFEAKMELILLKPTSSWLRIETDESIEITANNAHEGYILVENKTTGQHQLNVLPGPAVARLANGAWERLNFFDNPQRRFGRIEHKGMVRYDDRMCEKVVFLYPGNIWSARYFESQTGKLLMTAFDTGQIFMEEGAIHAHGIRFPARLHVRDGKHENKVIHFDSVVVNGEVDPEIFEFPVGR